MAHRAIQRLDEDLQNVPEKDRIGLLKKVYEQMIHGRGGRFKSGFYSDSMKVGADNSLEFVLYLEVK